MEPSTDNILDLSLSYSQSELLRLRDRPLEFTSRGMLATIYTPARVPTATADTLAIHQERIQETNKQIDQLLVQRRKIVEIGVKEAESRIEEENLSGSSVPVEEVGPSSAEIEARHFTSNDFCSVRKPNIVANHTAPIRHPYSPAFPLTFVPRHPDQDKGRKIAPPSIAHNWSFDVVGRNRPPYFPPPRIPFNSYELGESPRVYSEPAVHSLPDMPALKPRVAYTPSTARTPPIFQQPFMEHVQEELDFGKMFEYKDEDEDDWDSNE